MSDDARLLGARDGLVSGMLMLRREIGSVKNRLQGMPDHWTKKRASLLEILTMLQRMDAELDRHRHACAKAYRERQDVDIVSSNRPAPVDNLERFSTIRT